MSTFGLFCWCLVLHNRNAALMGAFALTERRHYLSLFENNTNKKLSLFDIHCLSVLETEVSSVMSFNLKFIPTCHFLMCNMHRPPLDPKLEYSSFSSASTSSSSIELQNSPNYYLNKYAFFSPLDSIKNHMQCLLNRAYY